MSIIVRVISRLGPDWTAAIALSVQALIFLLQAVILYWQGRILRRHAATLEKQTEIAGVQANNAAKIGATLANKSGYWMSSPTSWTDSSSSSRSWKPKRKG
jgi:hypothetical protein